jgi:hypothetical protein
MGAQVHFQEKPALAKEHQGVYARLRGLWVEPGFPSENATMQKCWSGFCFQSM